MLSEHINVQLKQGVKIITCDPPSGTIEAETRHGEVISINAYHFSPTFRWPVPGESWMVREENGSWYLDGIYEQQILPVGESVKPGDTIISAGSGIVWKNVEGHLELLTRTQLNVSDYIENIPARGFVLATKLTEKGEETKQEFKLPSSTSSRFILVIFSIRGTSNFGEVVLNEKHIAITERSGSAGTLYRTTLTVVVPPSKPCAIIGTASGEFPAEVILQHLWESVS